MCFSNTDLNNIAACLEHFKTETQTVYATN